MAQKLKKYVRYDGNRQLVPGSMIERVKQPSGKFEELQNPNPDGCCVPPPNPNDVYNRDGFLGYRQGEFVRAWPTYYLSDVYEPPAGNGVMVMPIHSAGVASDYPGRTGTVPSQPQGAVQMYFSMIDANDVDWSASAFLNYLRGGGYDFGMVQNGVEVIYSTLGYWIMPGYIAYKMPFELSPNSFYHDEVFGSTTPLTMTLKYQSMNGVAFNYKDPITLYLKYTNPY